MFGDRSVLVACFCGCALALGCTDVKATFNCVTDDECLWHGVAGRCEPTGFCSLPDTTCPLGWRYSSYAAGSLMHECVGSSGPGNVVEDNFVRPVVRNPAVGWFVATLIWALIPRSEVGA